jgi:hypothetical protein
MAEGIRETARRGLLREGDGRLQPSDRRNDDPDLQCSSANDGKPTNGRSGNQNELRERGDYRRTPERASTRVGRVPPAREGAFR